VLLTLTATSGAGMVDATALGFLLHKHPDRVQSFELAAGSATVLYPEASAARCTAALIVEVDTIKLADSQFRRERAGFALGRYLNDRPYAGASLLAVAIARVLRTALAGVCHARPELVQNRVPLEVTVPALPSRGGPELPAGLFGPLGWDVEAAPIALDPQIPAWGDSPYVSLTLRGELTVQTALRQLYVLLPVLDDVKHYWVGPDEADKLVRMAAEWLPGHPEAGLIAARYLAHQRELVVSIADRLLDTDTDEAQVEDANRLPGLAASRVDAVLAELRRLKARRIVDLGCGEGRLIRELLRHSEFEEVIGAEVSARELNRAARYLGLDRLPERQRARITLLQTSATYRDERLRGADAIVLMEVIEHIDLPRLPALVHTVFGARPGAVVVTTPNADYNPVYPGLAGGMRHPDHRFEFNRAQFAAWTADVAAAHGYTVRTAFAGAVDPERGGPTQLAVFTTISTETGEQP
jgi:3' terminal RNA ribose 2'-O-methyltransferase Hen1